ncbi:MULTISPECIES: hypothetical protein [unclassified Streptomyces]|uniref:hypothetical protein n=1 Tax=unclassified Streptomyces TaxID=2593676 RepID=UPI0011B94369|nr:MULTISPECIES: hypothetical protein [unclassified Streptomyces]MYS39162.1 hypothetical protein [Streptomyces sp. SID4920]MYX68613.1 hypothetical protein [Streptomyces sp. SID8373]
MTTLRCRRGGEIARKAHHLRREVDQRLSGEGVGDVRRIAMQLSMGVDNVGAEIHDQGAEFCLGVGLKLAVLLATGEPRGDEKAEDDGRDRGYGNPRRHSGHARTPEGWSAGDVAA